MERDIDRTMKSAEALRTLDGLQQDRAALTRRIRPPRWYYGALALVAGAWVATPALPEQIRSVATPLLIVLYVVLVASYPRLTGVRGAKVGWRTALLLVAALVIVLAMYSVALGLASALGAWWVVLPAVVTVAAVFGIGFATEHARKATLRDVR